MEGKMIFMRTQIPTPGSYLIEWKIFVYFDTILNNTLLIVNNRSGLLKKKIDKIIRAVQT